MFPSYYHSFGITKDNLVFIESPWRLNIFKLFKTFWNSESIDTAMVWKENVKTRFYLVSLQSGAIHPVVYQSDGFFAFHHINAYEEDGQVVVDVAGYDRVDVLFEMFKNPTGDIQGQNLGSATTRRYILPLNVEDAVSDQNLVTVQDSKAKAFLNGSVDGKPRIFCTPHHLTDGWVELPRINYRFNGEKFNYFYGVYASKGSGWTGIDTLTKVNVRNNSSICWSEEGMVPFEPIFVASPNSQDEDDGVILSTLLDKMEETQATLLILNAKDMQEVARVKFNTAGPFTPSFHGQWANESDKTHMF
ncbi:unnamed protein product [Allacma fusca]|uniref:Uncharacterized protein n=1 Tax=Allacma fusca TaxID=39272 RepID=A0A8J2P4G4_9HEXA|nr:unnamed protein product [Allacma fusca]